ncbi:hypothetical protein SAMN05192539_104712 [Paraburkholderia diazotrophica]|uniref:Uncharacterized protein n=1 Tax=Paraburkholderia diazotrophica TaxID=667676 RepID=A0A1H7E987_9BURK|nr:hypothetical protein SAMN05192539_104712 [Paraburkholderia diazotrophica]
MCWSTMCGARLVHASRTYRAGHEVRRRLAGSKSPGPTPTPRATAPASTLLLAGRLYGVGATVARMRSSPAFGRPVPSPDATPPFHLPLPRVQSAAAREGQKTGTSLTFRSNGAVPSSMAANALRSANPGPREQVHDEPHHVHSPIALVAQRLPPEVGQVRALRKSPVAWLDRHCVRASRDPGAAAQRHRELSSVDIMSRMSNPSCSLDAKQTASCEAQVVARRQTTGCTPQHVLSQADYQVRETFRIKMLLD